jgi:hypothetical protein
VRSEELLEPAKNSKGIGRSTYIITAREKELSSALLISISYISMTDEGHPLFLKHQI